MAESRDLTAGVLVLCACLAGCLSGCAVDTGVGAQASAPSNKRSCGTPALVSLWRTRQSSTTDDFPIGPGDVISLSVPEVEELQKQQVRVSPEGTIGLSLIGTMEVAGMTENDLRAAVRERLLPFMKYPRVDLFVEQYQTREVAVVGAVQKAGLYDLANSNQSLMDMIGRAGGMTEEAAQRVIFVPRKFDQTPMGNRNAGSLAHTDSLHQLAENGISVPASDSESTGLTQAAFRPSETAGYMDVQGRSWIVLDLAKQEDRACLDLPARPGDVVMVPIGGQVMVQGWVRNPGAFKIVPGMTILGAVSAAGGAMFSWTAELLRTDSEGKQTTTQFSLSTLADGKGSDVPVQSGDVVVVEKSALGAVPYTFFELFQHFGTGLGFPLP
jgi:polysaccharide export outer membrane protein